MIFFDQLSPKEQLKSLNEEINRMHLMIKLSKESLIQLNKTKKEVQKNFKK